MDAPASYLLSLEVENVRCFGPRQKLDLSDGKGRPAQWTVILGDNGVGKTTLLQCLVALERRRHFIRPGHKSFAPQVELPIPGSQWKIYRDPEKPEQTTVSGELAVGPTLGSAGQDYRIPAITVPVGSALQPKGVWPESVRGGALDELREAAFAARDLQCCAYGATRRSATKGPRRERSTDPASSLFSDSADLLDVESWLLSADYAARRDITGSKRRLRRIEATLVDLLPEVTGFEVSEDRGPDADDFEAPQIQATTPFGAVPFSQLSLGYRTMVAWIVDLASRLFSQYPSSRNPLAEPAVVLVDEVDLHLHPLWQRQLMTHLTKRFPNTQFIVTAHSPLVVQAAENQNLALLRREGDHVVIDNDVDHIRGWRIDQVLTSDLFGLETARPPAYDELIAERKALRSRRATGPSWNDSDEARLRWLDRQVDALPASESLEDAKAMDLIRQAAEKLQGGAASVR